MRNDAAPTIRWLTFTAWVSLLVFAATSTLMSVSLKQIGTDLAIGYSLRGLLALARSFVLASTTFLVGYTADRVGKRALLGTGMCVVALGLLLVGRSSGYAGLMGGTMVMAVGLGTLEALISPLIADLHPDDVDTQMNVMHAFFPVGIVLASQVVGRALDAGVAWRVPFTVVALPALAVAVMYGAGRYPDARAEARPRPVPVRRILATPLFWVLALAMWLTAGCEGALIYWSPNFIQDAYGATATTGAWGLTAFTAAMAVGRFGAGAAARRVPLSRIMLGAVFLAAGATLTLVLVSNLAVSIAMLTATGLLVACFWPSILTVANRRIAARSATLLAMLSVAGIAGFGVIPWGIGTLADVRGLRFGLGVVPIALLAAGGALLAVFRMDVGPVASASSQD
jgi:fucose permease